MIDLLVQLFNVAFTIFITFETMFVDASSSVEIVSFFSEIGYLLTLGLILTADELFHKLLRNLKL